MLCVTGSPPDGGNPADGIDDSGAIRLAVKGVAISSIPCRSNLAVGKRDPLLLIDDVKLLDVAYADEAVVAACVHAPPSS